GNPVDMVRVATLILLDNITIFGAAGAAMLRFLGGQTASLALLVVGLLVWVSIPLILSNRMLKRQDI
ncbi:MAG: ABC transporter permease, partial [Bacteroidota bacterium]